jgi:hypothetical protein
VTHKANHSVPAPWPTEFAKARKTLTLQDMTRIEYNAMVDAGVPKQAAWSLVLESRRNVRQMGVTAPAYSPYGGYP